MHNLRLVPQQKRTFYQGAIKIGQRKGHFHLKVGFVQQARHKSNRQQNFFVVEYKTSYIGFLKNILCLKYALTFLSMFLKNLDNFSFLYKHST